MNFDFSGKNQLEYCRRLSHSWRDLATILEIPPHDLARFEKGDEGLGIWNWLAAREELMRLPPALESINRKDLAEIFSSVRNTAQTAAPLGANQTNLSENKSTSMPSAARDTVFISYSRKDARWLQRLQTHLQPLVRSGTVQAWDDTQICAGDDWQAEIDNALARAKVAVLLISADFLASEFIANNELPPLLARAQSHGTVILPLIVSPSLFEYTPELARYQAVNSPSKPLSKLSKAKQEAVLVDLARAVLGALKRVSGQQTGTASEKTPSTATLATTVKILFLASNPDETARLALDKEARSIREKLRASQYRDAFEFHTEWAVRPKDLLQYFREYRPHIVHFSGHGSPSAELELEDDNGAAKPVSKAALVTLFKVMKENIRVVLLNACYSHSQSEAIAEHIDCTIGMNKAIGDQAAIVFAAEFYGALGFGYSVKDAFEQAQTALMLEGIPEENTPELIARAGIDSAQVFLVEPDD